MNGEDPRRWTATDLPPATEPNPPSPASAPSSSPTASPSSAATASTPTTWLVDVDGTLAKKGDRSPYDMTRVSLDTPITPVITLVQALAAHPRVGDIIIVSGRSEEARAETENWLTENRVPYSRLILRDEGDYRPDDVVKRGILDRLRSEGHVVEGVVDDRDKVVAMWRDEGLVCLQAAPGNF